MKNQLLWIVMTAAPLAFGRGSASAQLSMQESASQGLLRPLGPMEIATLATFWSWQNSSPLPYNPCPDCPAYALPNGSGVLVDERGVSYGAEGSLGASQLSANGPLDSPPPDYGCGLWLELHFSNSLAHVTIHNTVAGRTNKLWSSSALTNPIANWTLEATVTATGDPSVVPVATNGRPILFFRASELRDYTNEFKFDGVSSADVQNEMAAPDCMGAVSADRFVELINGKIRVFNKSDTNFIVQDTLNQFFTVVSNGITYPKGLAIDPRIIYDPISNRWVACAIDVDNGTNQGSLQFLLAVSLGSSPDDLTNGWRRHVVDVEPVRGMSEGLQAMGMDANGIYLDKKTSTNSQFIIHTNVAIKRSLQRHPHTDFGRHPLQCRGPGRMDSTRLQLRSARDQRLCFSLGERRSGIRDELPGRGCFLSKTLLGRLDSTTDE